MLKLSLKTHTADHLEITITPDEYFKNNQPPTNHVLTQIIKDHFTFLYGQKHRRKPFVKLLVTARTMGDIIYTVDDNLSKQLYPFIDHLVPETSLITFYENDDTKTYRYLGEKDNVMTFEQVRYNNDYNPIVTIPILK